MSIYTDSIITAAIFTVVLSVVIFIPWLIYTYRKYGFLSLSKTIIVFSFIFYMFSALFLVLLPFPTTRDTCAMQSPDTVHYNLHLFQFISDILYRSGIQLNNPATWMLVFKQPAFYQAFFNFLLLMPLGIYLRYFLGSRKFWKRAFIISFSVTLFFEVTQGTGVYGIFNCPYRLFDVDDLLLNSTGAFIGFFIAPVFLMLLPSHKDVVNKAAQLEAEDIVKPVAIIIALFIDLFLVKLGWVVLGSFMTNNMMTEFLVTTLLYMFAFVIIPTTLGGATIGMKFMRFKMVGNTSGATSNYGSLRRFIAIYATYALFMVAKVLNQIEVPFESPMYTINIFVNLAAIALVLVLYIVLFIHIVRVLIGGGKRPLYIDRYANMHPTRKK